MIDIFVIGVKVLLILTSLFFLVIFFLCSAWAHPRNPERHFIIGFLVSILGTFWFFLAGFLLLALINNFYKYLFPLIQSWKFLL